MGLRDACASKNHSNVFVQNLVDEMYGPKKNQWINDYFKKNWDRILVSVCLTIMIAYSFITIKQNTINMFVQSLGDKIHGLKTSPSL